MNKFLILLCACLLSLAAYTQCPDLNNDVVFINEIHYDNTGADADEGVEIAGPAGTDLSDYSLIFYNGADGLAYLTVPLSGLLPNESNGFGTIWFPIAGIQNGLLDGIALYNNVTLTIVQFLSYGGTFTAGDGVAQTITSEDIGVSETGSTPLGSSLQLTGGPGNCASDFSWTGPVAESGASGSTINTGQSFVAAGTCLLSGLTVTQTDCSYFTGPTGTQTQVATIELDFNYYNVGGANFVLQVAPDPGSYTGTTPAYTSLPLTLNNFADITSGNTYTFLVSDELDPGCQLTFITGQTFSCPTATTLGFTLEPTNCLIPNTPFTVEVCAVNAGGEVQTNYTSTISITGSTIGTITGTTSLVPTNGCATFTLSSTIVQTLTLTATDGNGPLTLNDGTSNPIEILAACPEVEILTGVINPCGEDSQNEYIAASTGISSVNVADLVFASIDHTSGTQPNVNYTWSASGTDVAGSTTEICGGIGLQCNQLLDINNITDGPIIADLINQLNTQAGCALFVAPAGGAGTFGTIPANANFIFFPGAGGNAGAGILPGFDPLAFPDFSIFCGSAPIYAIFGYHNNPNTIPFPSFGFFSNSEARTYQVSVNGNITSSLAYPVPSGAVEAETFGSDLLYYSGADCVPIYLFGAAPLAPELLAFEGSWTDAGQVQLDWELAAGEALEDFVIERSLAGSEFEPIGTVDAIREGSLYQFRDTESGPASRQYRLRMVMSNGDFRYSERITLEMEIADAPGIFAVYPNPVTDQLHLSVSSPDKAQLSLGISAMDGRTLSWHTWEVAAGVVQVNTSLEALPAGMYLYQVVLGNWRKHGVLVKE